ncbi:(deoxy)nucleoside triphosphate pyrophosphohydrolase [Pedobacter psychroterrae]|uniref:8-oxo-dGTP diphosphatase n=1 Tax=Pedobacter psychroterrae TaxID=2530453 RepID=A0A4R0NNG9_9SPHI|nr:(deoxy)nucleoside triphosphate pyrophosphohydrolase [Pedobacter psychroterrae]TCD01183.1 (deoxy)nucleoside triphosphate pyrophosphohydrolase [Pedobacter psychroterrae]
MIDVACAIIITPEKRVLVTQRSAEMKLPLKIEFPGGKVEAGEMPDECIVREIKEELNLDVRPVFEMQPHVHTYPHATIRLIPFVCRIIGGEIKLSEHLAYAWLAAEELMDLDWAEADIPVLKRYLTLAHAGDF